MNLRTMSASLCFAEPGARYPGPESETIMLAIHRTPLALFGRRVGPGPPSRPTHRSPRQRFTLEPLEGRALLSYLTVSVPDNVVAETPFTMTATVFRDDQTVDTDYNGDVNVWAESFWQLASHGYENFVGSSIDGPSTVSAVNGVATFNWTVDPAPGFRLTLSAVVPDPNVEGGYTAITAQTDLGVSPFPDQLTFIEPPPSSLVAGAPFSMTVAAVDSSGNIDTSFNQLVGLGGIDSRYGGYWGNNPPIDGVRFANASAGVATFTGLSVEHETGFMGAATYGVWSPDIRGELGFSIAVSGPATRFTPQIWASPNSPDTSIVAGHAFSVSTLAFDSDWNFASSFNGNVMITLANNPAGANLGGTLTVTAANGVVNFSDLTLDKPGTDYTLQISSDGVATATTLPFNVQTTVDTVGVGWGTRTATLQTASDGLRLLPAGRSTDLPWLGIKQLQINLAQAHR